ncbi:MAG: topoisomerase [Thermoplasmata archaeon]
MRIEEELKGVEDTLDTMREDNRSIPIIVEGKKDVEALRALGFEGVIIKIKGRKTIFHIIEGMRGKYEEVIVLTDWDHTGRRLAGRIKRACRANSIKPDMEYRRRLIKHLKKEIKDVESIPPFIIRARSLVRNPRKRRNEENREN